MWARISAPILTSPGAHLTSHSYNGYRIPFPKEERFKCGANHPPPCRIDLYLYSFCRPWWCVPVQHLPFTRSIRIFSTHSNCDCDVGNLRGFSLDTRIKKYMHYKEQELSKHKQKIKLSVRTPRRHKWKRYVSLLILNLDFKGKWVTRCNTQLLYCLERSQIFLEWEALKYESRGESYDSVILNLRRKDTWRKSRVKAEGRLC